MSLKLAGEIIKSLLRAVLREESRPAKSWGFRQETKSILRRPTEQSALPQESLHIDQSRQLAQPLYSIHAVQPFFKLPWRIPRGLNTELACCQLNGRFSSVKS